MPYSAADVRARECLARILICALPKAGKSCCAALTSPGPRYILNSDGQGALDPVVLLGGDFQADDITDYASFKRSMIWLQTNMGRFYDPANGVRGTVILDNISTFAGRLLLDVKKELKNGLQYYPELNARLAEVIRTLIALPLHVVILGHIKPGEKLSGEGTKMLSLPGNSGTAVSALMQDWIGLDVSVDPATNQVKREFLLAPEGAWQAAARSVKNIQRMPADISLFLSYVKQQRDQPVEEGTEVVEEEVVQPVQEEQLQEQPEQEAQPQTQSRLGSVPTYKPRAATRPKSVNGSAKR